jgi:hypothetical protein
MGEYEFLHFPADAVRVDESRFVRLPESAQRVFGAVKVDGPLTHAELRDRTGLPPRTIRFAVRRDCVEDHALEDARLRAHEASLLGKLVEQV